MLKLVRVVACEGAASKAAVMSAFDPLRTLACWEFVPPNHLETRFIERVEDSQRHFFFGRWQMPHCA